MVPRILLTNCYDEAPRAIVEEACETVCRKQGVQLQLLHPKDTSRESLLERVEEADYLLISGRQPINHELLTKATRLKMMQRTGMGMDMMDMEEVKRFDVPVYVNAGVNAQSVAEYTLLLILSCLRRYPAINNQLKSGIWKKQSNGIETHQLAGKKVGLLGLGRIGQKVAGLLQAFGAEVIYYDMFRSKEAESRGIVYVSQKQLLKEAEIVSLHCPLTKETRHIINKETLAAMRKDAILINTARGSLINQEDLLKALQENQIRAAAIDVFEKEPVTEENPLLRLENCFVSPHIGGVTRESFLQMMEKAFANIAAFEKGNIEGIAKNRYIG